MHLIAGAVSTSANNSLVPLYYVFSIIMLLAGIIYGSVKFWNRSKKQWADEGAAAARQAEAIEANTKAAAANTNAITKLTDELRSFTTETRAALNGHKERIERLEDRK